MKENKLFENMFPSVLTLNCLFYCSHNKRDKGSDIFSVDIPSKSLYFKTTEFTSLYKDELGVDLNMNF